MLTKDVLTNSIQELAEELGHPPSANQMRNEGPHGISSYYKYFESWTDALREAGFDDSEGESKYGGYEESELIEMLQEYTEEIGHAPRYREWRNNGPVSNHPYERVFGTWDQALEAADVVPNPGKPPEKNGERGKSSKFSREELIEEIHRLKSELGRAPTRDDLNEHSSMSRAVFRNEFGTWTRARNEAGVGGPIHPNGPDPTPKHELEKALLELTEELGRTPYTADMDEMGDFSSRVYRSRFEGWEEALKFADLEPQRAVGGENRQGANPYSGGWNKVRRDALERDGRQCQVCNLTNEEHVEKHGENLHAHHITPVKEFDHPHSAHFLDNVITLCMSCHNRWEGIPLKPERGDA